MNPHAKRWQSLQQQGWRLGVVRGPDPYSYVLIAWMPEQERNDGTIEGAKRLAGSPYWKGGVVQKRDVYRFDPDRLAQFETLRTQMADTRQRMVNWWAGTDRMFTQGG